LREALVTLTLAELADKMGSGLEAAIGACVVLVIPLWLSRWRCWLYALVVPALILGNQQIVCEMRSTFGGEVISELGVAYYVKCLVSWNVPYVAATPLAIVRHRRWVRRDRRSRGACANCGYDLRGDPASACPECGWNRAETTG
jgi:hypothetical protein